MPSSALRTRIISLSCLALVILLPAASYAQRPGGKIVAGGELVRIQAYPGAVANVQHWVAVDKGFLEAHGLKGQITNIASGPLGLQALAAGSLEIAFASTDVSMQAFSRGTDIRVIVGHSPANLYTLDVHKDVPLPNLSAGYPKIMQDLKGLKVGVTARGSAVELQTRALLIGAGLKPDDVTFVAVGSPGTSYPALLARRIDAAMMFEPFATLCIVQKTCVHAIDLRKGEGPADLKALNGAFETYTATQAYIQAHPVVIDAFIQAIEDSTRWVKDPANFDELVQIVKHYFTLGEVPDAEATLRQLVRDQLPTYGTPIDRKAIKGFSDYLVRNKLIDKAVDPAAFVYPKAP